MCNIPLQNVEFFSTIFPKLLQVVTSHASPFFSPLQQLSIFLNPTLPFFSLPPHRHHLFLYNLLRFLSGRRFYPFQPFRPCPPGFAVSAGSCPSLPVFSHPRRYSRAFAGSCWFLLVLAGPHQSSPISTGFCLSFPVFGCAHLNLTNFTHACAACRSSLVFAEICLCSLLLTGFWPDFPDFDPNCPTSPDVISLRPCSPDLPHLLRCSPIFGRALPISPVFESGRLSSFFFKRAWPTSLVFPVPTSSLTCLQACLSSLDFAQLYGRACTKRPSLFVLARPHPHTAVLAPLPKRLPDFARLRKCPLEFSWLRPCSSCSTRHRHCLLLHSNTCPAWSSLPDIAHPCGRAHPNPQVFGRSRPCFFFFSHAYPTSTIFSRARPSPEVFIRLCSSSEWPHDFTSLCSSSPSSTCHRTWLPSLLRTLPACSSPQEFALARPFSDGFACLCRNLL